MKRIIDFFSDKIRSGSQVAVDFTTGNCTFNSFITVEAVYIEHSLEENKTLNTTKDNKVIHINHRNGEIEILLSSTDTITYNKEEGYIEICTDYGSYAFG